MRLLRRRPRVTYRAAFFKCEACEGIGTWRPGRGPDPRPALLNVATLEAQPGDQTISSERGDTWIVCGDCKGTGWTTRGLRCGRKGDAKAGRHWGRCFRCETVWAFVEGHRTKYSFGSGCFPLCEACWSELTVTERLPYYRQLWDQWQADAAKHGYREHSIAEWDAIEAAVMEGL